MTYQGLELSKHHLPEGNVTYTRLFEEVHTAHEWNVPLGVYFSLPPEERATMMVYVRSKDTLESLVQEDSRRKSDARYRQGKS